ERNADEAQVGAHRALDRLVRGVELHLLHLAARLAADAGDRPALHEVGDAFGLAVARLDVGRADGEVLAVVLLEQAVDRAQELRRGVALPRGAAILRGAHIDLRYLLDLRRAGAAGEQQRRPDDRMLHRSPFPLPILPASREIPCRSAKRSGTACAGRA